MPSTESVPHLNEFPIYPASERTGGLHRAVDATDNRDMERRKLIAVAGALSAAAFATTVGLGANLGLFDMTQPDSGAGRLSSMHIAVTLPVPSVNPNGTPNDPPEPPTTVDRDGRADDD